MVIEDIVLGGDEAVFTGILSTDYLIDYNAAFIDIQDLVLTEVVLPKITATYWCGASDKKWSSVWCVVLHEGDHVFEEKTCCLCDKEFKEGEAIINYVLSNTEEGTRTIPAHMTCISKSENQTKIKHDLVIQKLKDTKKYIDPMEEITRMKEMKIKLEEVKMEKITLKDGKKGLLVVKGGKFRAFSEEQLIELEKKYLDRLTEIQNYIQELNK